MEGDGMKDRDLDEHLRLHFSGDRPQEAFKQQTLRDSTAEFVRVRRRRSALRGAELAAAAILVAGVAFLGGRLSAPRALPRNVDAAPQAAAVSGTPRGEPEGVTVPSDLVAWLDAARLFGQLGMEERMARAVERAAGLLPVEALSADGQTTRVLAAGESDDSQGKRMEPSAQSVNQILAQLFGD